MRRRGGDSIGKVETVEAEILRHCEEEPVVLLAALCLERLCFCLACGDLFQNWDEVRVLVDQNGFVVETRFARRCFSKGHKVGSAGQQ